MCDFGNLAHEVDLLHKAEVPAFHLDVMDGNFVPNLSYGMPIIAGLRKLTDLPLDVHLMIDRPESCLLYTSPSPRDATLSRMPSSA